MKNNNGLFCDLDREIEAANKFLQKTNENLFKQSSFIKIDEENCNTNEINEETTTKINKKEDFKIFKKDKLFSYRKQLKNLGFPEIPNFSFENEEDKEKMFNFFDYIMLKKNSENEETFKIKKKFDSFQVKIEENEKKIFKLENEIKSKNLEISNFYKLLKEEEQKNNKIKEIYEKQLNDIKSSNKKINSLYQNLLIDKKGLEDKYNKLINSKLSNLNKMNQQTFIFNEPLKKNNIYKVLNKTNGTEKLIETLKNGYNDSLKELIYEVNALKNFILEINENITKISKNSKDLNSNILNVPFLDNIHYVKKVVLENIETCLIKTKNKDFKYKDKEDLKNISVNDYDNDNTINLELEKEFIEDNEKIKKVEEEEEEINDDQLEFELSLLKKKWIDSLYKKE